MHSVSLRGIVLVVAMAIVWAALIPQTADAVVTCTKGVSRLATAADLENMRLAGIPNPTVGMEYCPDDLNTGASVGNDKIYLRSILCPPDGDNYGGTGPDGTIEGLDAKFAQCAASFLKQLNSSVAPYCIREGKRTVEKQNSYVARGVIACTKGAMCEHPRGIAIDINIVSGNKGLCDNYTRAHQLAPQFGLTFYMGCKDAYHFVPQKAGCSAGGTSPTNGAPTSSGFPTGGTNFNPNATLPTSFYDYPQYAPAGATQPFSNPLTSFTPSQSTQTTPTNNSPTSYPTDYTYTFPSASSTYVESPYTYTPPTSTKKTATSGPSASEQIDTISGNTGTSGNYQTATSAPTKLNDDLRDITRGSKTGGTNIIESELALNTLADNSVVVNPIHVTETFSHDEPTVVQSSTTGTDARTVKTLIVSMLTTLRNLLVTFVQMLTSRSTNEFQGSVKAPATQPVYR